jgi:hypothetical protein
VKTEFNGHVRACSSAIRQAVFLLPVRARFSLRFYTAQMSGFPSLPPPIYKFPRPVSLLDSKALAAREAEYKKWVSLVYSN